jgi:hypothetical protein
LSVLGPNPHSDPNPHPTENTSRTGIKTTQKKMSN